MKTAVVILNWNGRELLEKFLPSVVRDTTDEGSEVIVVDNCSTDDSVAFIEKYYPLLRVIIHDKNYGFADGYNKAIAQIDAQYVVLLNSDVETSPGWLTPLVDYLDSHEKVVAAQPKIMYQREPSLFEYAGASGGYIDKYGYPFCRGRIIDTVEADNGQYDDIVNVFWASGACLLIRRDDYVEAGGLDGSFFAHMEEIDLCWRLNARGRHIVCVTSSKVYHLGGATLNKDNPRKLYLNYRNNLLMLYKNFFPKSIFRQIDMICARVVFDLLVFLKFLFFGKQDNAMAIQKAYKDFFKSKDSYKHTRYDNITKSTVDDIAPIYPNSIIIKYFFAGCKKFSDLNRWWRDSLIRSEK